MQTLDDVIYGKVAVPEGVIKKLIASPEMQRLKDIDMAGYSAGYYLRFYD